MRLSDLSGMFMLEHDLGIRVFLPWFVGSVNLRPGDEPWERGPHGQQPLFRTLLISTTGIIL